MSGGYMPFDAMAVQKESNSEATIRFQLDDLKDGHANTKAEIHGKKLVVSTTVNDTLYGHETQDMDIKNPKHVVKKSYIDVTVQKTAPFSIASKLN